MLRGDDQGTTSDAHRRTGRRSLPNINDTP
jgi:hypothetical protein